MHWVLQGQGGSCLCRSVQSKGVVALALSCGLLALCKGICGGMAHSPLWPNIAACTCGMLIFAWAQHRRREEAQDTQSRAQNAATAGAEICLHAGMRRQPTLGACAPTRRCRAAFFPLALQLASGGWVCQQHLHGVQARNSQHAQVEVLARPGVVQCMRSVLRMLRFSPPTTVPPTALGPVGGWEGSFHRGCWRLGLAPL